MKRIGIIAGRGELPAAIAEDATSQGYSVFVLALEPVADADFGAAAEVRKVNIGKLGKIIATLKRAGISEVVMAGKVPKSLLYKSRIVPDLRAAKVLFSLKDRRDDSIMLAITDELAAEGISLARTTDFAAGLLSPDGVITKAAPTEDQWRDIEFGWRIAKEMGRLDIGQTVVVKTRAVMAIEAIEGTDEAIRSGGALARKDAVVVKVSKPQQDMRFDVPVVGPDTLTAMKEVHARVLAVEAGRSLFLRRKEMVAQADKLGIVLVGHRSKP